MPRSAAFRLQNHRITLCRRQISRLSSCFTPLPPKGCAPGTWRPYQDAPESSAVSNLRWTRRRVSSNLGSCRVLLKTRARLTPPKLPVCHLKRSEEHTSELQSL